MRDDQIVRVAASFSVALIFASHVAFNGSAPVKVWLLADQSPLFLALATQMLLAFPELIDRLPFGPTRSKDKS